MPPHALAVEKAADLPPGHGDDERPDWRRHAAEEGFRSHIEIGVVHPAVVHDGPIEIVLEHLLEGPGDGALFGVKPAVEIDVVLFSRCQRMKVESAMVSPSSTI
jgi:hypothetical protein